MPYTGTDRKFITIFWNRDQIQNFMIWLFVRKKLYKWRVTVLLLYSNYTYRDFQIWGKKRLNYLYFPHKKL